MRWGLACLCVFVACEASAQQSTECVAERWTFGPGQETLRDGVHIGGGFGSEYRCHQDAVVVFGNPAWWMWDGTRWNRLSAQPPSSQAFVGVQRIVAASAVPEATAYRLIVNGTQVLERAASVAVTNNQAQLPWTPKTTGTYVVTIASTTGTDEKRAMPMTVTVVTMPVRPIAPMNVSPR